MADEAARGLFHGFQRGRAACRSGGAIGVACIDDNRAHAAFGGAQILLGDHNGWSDNEVLREDGGGRSRNVTGEQRQVQRASLLQATSSGRETESARESGFGEDVLHGMRIREAGMTLTEATSDPPRDAKRLRKC